MGEILIAQMAAGEKTRSPITISEGDKNSDKNGDSRDDTQAKWRVN